MVKAPVPRNVESLKVLLTQINRLAPNRSKASDGWIGDVKHQSRHSDHNPEPDGTVDARDFTNDPSGGCDARKLCQAILDSKDPRLSYVISNGQIASGRKGPKPWVWRKYSGSNGHYHHAHVSVLDEGQDDKTPWNIDSAFKKSAAEVLTKKQVSSVMSKGSKGEFVEELQVNLVKLGFGPLKADGRFGDDTEKAVRAFQRTKGLLADGWAGPRTLEAIGKELENKKLAPKVEKAEAQVKEANTKVDAAKEVVDNAAAKGKRFSSTEVVTTITGVTGVATAAKEGIDAVKESTSSFYDLLVTAGPWLLLGIVLAGGAIYIINERRNKRLEAKAVQKVM